MCVRGGRLAVVGEWCVQMRCLGCGAEMRLMQVVLDDTRMLPGLERHTFKCTACPEIARRVRFSRPQIPVTNLPVITRPTNTLWNGCVAAPSVWGKAVETVRSRQTELKERAAAAKTATWTKAVQKLRSRQTALAEQATAAAAHLRLAEPVRAPAAHSDPSASPNAANEHVAPQSAWARAVAKLRARQDRGL